MQTSDLYNIHLLDLLMETDYLNEEILP